MKHRVNQLYTAGKKVTIRLSRTRVERFYEALKQGVRKRERIGGHRGQRPEISFEIGTRFADLRAVFQASDSCSATFKLRSRLEHARDRIGNSFLPPRDNAIQGGKKSLFAAVVGEFYTFEPAKLILILNFWVKMFYFLALYLTHHEGD